MWLLIIVIMTKPNDFYFDRAEAISIEFSSKESCEAAAKGLNLTYSTANRVVCAQK